MQNKILNANYKNAQGSFRDELSLDNLSQLAVVGKKQVSSKSPSLREIYQKTFSPKKFTIR